MIMTTDAQVVLLTARLNLLEKLVREVLYRSSYRDTAYQMLQELDELRKAGE